MAEELHIKHNDLGGARTRIEKLLSVTGGTETFRPVKDQCSKPENDKRTGPTPPAALSKTITTLTQEHSSVSK